MRGKDEYYIKSLLDTLEKDGVETIYELIIKQKLNSGSSAYSALINDLIACCPSRKNWHNPRFKEIFKEDIKYYCNYYLTDDD